MLVIAGSIVLGGVIGWRIWWEEYPWLSVALSAMFAGVVGFLLWVSVYAWAVFGVTPVTWSDDLLAFGPVSGEVYEWVTAEDSGVVDRDSVEIVYMGNGGGDGASRIYVTEGVCAPVWLAYACTSAEMVVVLGHG